MEAATSPITDPYQRTCEHCGGVVRYIVKFKWWRCFGCGRRWNLDYEPTTYKSGIDI